MSPLAEQFGVTPETVRRDLTVLERPGHVRRVHGGAIPIERFGFEPTLAARDAVLTAEKERIAKAALAELPEEGAILLDAGTTTRRFAELLPADRELTVVVNSPPLATLLARRANVTVMMLGGRVRGRTLAAVDDWGTRAARRRSTSTSRSWRPTGSQRRARADHPRPGRGGGQAGDDRRARRTVLLADHTKIGNDYFARVRRRSPTSTRSSPTPALDAGARRGDRADAGPRVVRA